MFGLTRCAGRSRGSEGQNCGQVDTWPRPNGVGDPHHLCAQPMGLCPGLCCNAWIPGWNLTAGGERCKTLGLHPCLRPRILGDAFLTRTPAASLALYATVWLYLAKKPPCATPGPGSSRAFDGLNRGDRPDQRPWAAPGCRRDWERVRRSSSATASHALMPYAASSEALRNSTRSGGTNIKASMILRGTFICCA